MGLCQALQTAVSGLMSHQTALDNIGNNLANINTTGYKKGVYQFSTMLEQTIRGGMSANGATGSVNPVGLGVGTQTASINKVFTQSQTESTGSATDLAINGNGFFVVSSGNSVAYTRDGSFCISDDGYLVNASGMYVQGTMAVRNADGSVAIPQDSKLENMLIPLNSTGGMSKTSTVSFAGNINSNQSVAGGLQLFGSNAPTVNDLQDWMSTKYNSTDTSWNALEQSTFFVPEGLNVQAPAGSNISTYSYEPVPSAYQYAYDPASGEIIDFGGATSVEDIAAMDPAYIPVMKEIGVINGGNVQTSQAMGVQVPEYCTVGDVQVVDGVKYTVQNSSTYPAWFYEANGGDFSAMYNLTDAEIDADALAAAWPNGFQGDGVVPTGTASLPRGGETYPATLDTPLSQLYTYENGKWTQMFPNLKEGDEITVSFEKGGSIASASFTYNIPGLEAVGNQRKVDFEKSYTLEHFLTFLAGDVDRAGSACAQISPDMFATEEEYNAALANLNIAKSDSNLNTSGGVMGLIDVPAQISAANGGVDAYDAPMETAGAFSREGVSQVNYTRYDADGNPVTVKSDSFNISLVSNLGEANALSNITISHNNVTNKTAFSNETDYAAEQGGSTTASVTFYDSLGNARTATVRMTLVGEDSNFSTWRWYADCEDDTDFGWTVDPDTGEISSSSNVGTGLFRFDADGNFVSGSDYSETGGIVINLANMGVDDTIQVTIQNGLNSGKTQDLDFSAMKYSAAAGSVSLESQNGAPPGSLEDFTVASDGTVYGSYSTGKTEVLGRLVLATVTNVNGLQAGSGNLYYTTPASGEAQYAYPELGGRGSIGQYMIETSNVDMSEEFTKMIAIERGYQANSRIITTADEMLQELLSMVR